MTVDGDDHDVLTLTRFPEMYPVVTGHSNKLRDESLPLE